MWKNDKYEFFRERNFRSSCMIGFHDFFRELKLEQVAKNKFTMKGTSDQVAYFDITIFFFHRRSRSRSRDRKDRHGEKSKGTSGIEGLYKYFLLT